MEQLTLYTYIAVFGTFALYFAIAWWARAWQQA
jgi:cation/acetate symporter